VSQTVSALLQLRDLILSGELAPGQRLQELAIVDRLGVSRTPVRAALVRLEEEGLVEAIPSGGYAVRAFSEQEVDEAIEKRKGVRAEAIMREHALLAAISNWRCTIRTPCARCAAHP
jgi:GntR family transcriptional regulator of vanillate catabolism